MKNRLIASLLIIVFLAQEVSWAQSSFDNQNLAVPGLQNTATVERMETVMTEVSARRRGKAPDLPGRRDEGISSGKERLRSVDFRHRDYYFVLGDVDRLSSFNKIYSKAIMGSLRRPADPDIIIYKGRSVFGEILHVLADKCATRGFGVYRYLAGDEFVPQADYSDKGTVEAALNSIRETFNSHFKNEGAYLVAKMDGRSGLSAKEEKFLKKKDDVLAVARYGENYYVLMKKRGRIADQIADLSAGLTGQHKAVTHELNGGVMPPFTVSIGSMSARAVIGEMESAYGAEILDGEGHIKEEFIDDVYSWGMNMANDMLHNAKRKRNDVCVMDRVDTGIIHKPIKKSRVFNTGEGIDALTGFYDQARFRSAISGNDNLIQIEIATYNGDPSRDKGSFHAVNSALGYNGADEVIRIISQEIKEVFWRIGYGRAVFGRAPPDKFLISLDRRVEPALLGSTLMSAKEAVESRLNEEKIFHFDIHFKASSVHPKDIKHSRIKVFRNRFRVIDVISKLEKLIEMASSNTADNSPIEKSVDRIKIGGSINIPAVDIRAYKPGKEITLEAKYRLMQKVEKEEAIRGFSQKLPAKRTGYAGSLPDPGLVRDAKGLANYMDQLRIREGRFMKLASEPQKYEENFFRPLFEVLFASLERDFTDSGEFIALARKIMDEHGVGKLRGILGSGYAPLVAAFDKIKESGNSATASIDLYGVLLSFLTGRPEKYLRDIYVICMKSRPKEKIIFSKKGVPLHGRGDSVVITYPKTILFEGAFPTYRNSLKAGEEAPKNGSETDPENVSKIEAALRILEERLDTYSYNEEEKNNIRGRLRLFRSVGTVMELDMKTSLLFSIPDHNLVRPMHAGRSRSLLVLPRPFLNGLSLKDERDMKILAFWLNYGMHFLELHYEMTSLEVPVKDMQARLSEFTREYFDKYEDSRLFSKEEINSVIKAGLAKLMESDTVTKYGEILDEVMKLEEEAHDIMDTKKKSYMDPRQLDRAVKIYSRLMYRYEGMGLYKWADRAYVNMAQATSAMQSHDPGGIAPVHSQVNLVLTALRFGRPVDFIGELKTLLKAGMEGSGYPRMITRQEIDTTKALVTSERGEFSTSFEGAVMRALAAHAEVEGSAEWEEAQAEAGKMLEEYFKAPFEDLALEDVDYSSANPSTRVRLAAIARKALTEINRTAYDVFKVFRRGDIRPSPRDELIYYTGARHDLDSFIRARLERIGEMLLPGELYTISKIMRSSIDTTIYEFDSSVLPARDGQNGPRGWMLGFGAFSPQPDTRSDDFSSALQRFIYPALPKIAGMSGSRVPDDVGMAFLSRQVLDKIMEKEAILKKEYGLNSYKDVLREYLFAVLSSPYINEDASIYLRGRLFHHNYRTIGDKPGEKTEVGALDEIFREVIQDGLQEVSRKSFTGNFMRLFKNVSLEIYDLLKSLYKDEAGSMPMTGHMESLENIELLRSIWPRISRQERDALMTGGGTGLSQVFTGIKAGVLLPQNGKEGGLLDKTLLALSRILPLFPYAVIRTIFIKEPVAYLEKFLRRIRVRRAHDIRTEVIKTADGKYSLYYSPSQASLQLRRILEELEKDGELKTLWDLFVKKDIDPEKPKKWIKSITLAQLYQFIQSGSARDFIFYMVYSELHLPYIGSPASITWSAYKENENEDKALFEKKKFVLSQIDNITGADTLKEELLVDMDKFSLFFDGSPAQNLASRKFLKIAPERNTPEVVNGFLDRTEDWSKNPPRLSYPLKDWTEGLASMGPEIANVLSPKMARVIKDPKGSGEIYAEIRYWVLNAFRLSGGDPAIETKVINWLRNFYMKNRYLLIDGASSVIEGATFDMNYGHDKGAEGPLIAMNAPFSMWEYFSGNPILSLSASTVTDPGSDEMTFSLWIKKLDDSYRRYGLKKIFEENRDSLDIFIGERRIESWDTKFKVEEASKSGIWVYPKTIDQVVKTIPDPKDMIEKREAESPKAGEKSYPADNGSTVMNFVELPDNPYLTGDDKNVLLAAADTWADDVELDKLDTYADRLAAVMISAAQSYHERTGKIPKVALLSYHTTNAEEEALSLFDYLNGSLSDKYLERLNEARAGPAKVAPRTTKLNMTREGRKPELEKAYVQVLEKAFRIAKKKADEIGLSVIFMGRGNMQFDSAMIEKVYTKKTGLEAKVGQFPPNVFVFPTKQSYEFCNSALKVASKMERESAKGSILDEVYRKLQGMALSSLADMIFPETIDPKGALDKRVISSALEVAKNGLAKVVLIYHDDKALSAEFPEIPALVKDNRLEITDPRIVNQKADIDLKANLSASRKLLKRAIDEKRHIGMVAGAELETAEVIKTSAWFKMKNVQDLYDYFLMLFPDKTLGENGLVMYVNTAVQECPDANGVKDMALSAASTFKGITSKEPKIALLTTGSKDSEKMSSAWAALKKERPQLDIGQGPVTLEEAFSGKYNVVIFPDLMSGNICYKWSERLLGARALGPIILGTEVPISDLSRGATAQDIRDTAVVLSSIASSDNTESSEEATDIISLTLALGRKIRDASPSIQYDIESSLNDKAIVLYADDLLERAAAADLFQVIKDTQVLDKSTLIIYGRDGRKADLLDKIIREASAGKKINVVKITSDDLSGYNDYNDIKGLYPNEAKELGLILRKLSANGVQSANILGVVKGMTGEDSTPLMRDLAKERGLPIVSFMDDKGIYSFKQAMAELIAISRDPAPQSGREWYRILRPIEKENIERAYQDYRRALDVAINA